MTHKLVEHEFPNMGVSAKVFSETEPTTDYTGKVHQPYTDYVFIIQTPTYKALPNRKVDHLQLYIMHKDALPTGREAALLVLLKALDKQDADTQREMDYVEHWQRVDVARVSLGFPSYSYQPNIKITLEETAHMRVLIRDELRQLQDIEEERLRHMESMQAIKAKIAENAPKISSSAGPRPNPNKVYVIGPEEGPYKVGVTSGKIEKRIRSIQTGCPHPIRIFQVIETQDAARIEGAAHFALSSFRTSGEWFNAPLDMILSTVNGLAA